MINKKKLLELKTRKDIYDIITKYPGLHLREIIRNLNYSEGTIRYHLNHLIKQGVIIDKTEEKYIRYYKKDAISITEKKLIHIIRKDVPRNIILYLLFLRYKSQKQLSEDLGKDPKTIEYHLKQLIKLDIIEEIELKDGFFQTRYKNAKKIEFSRKNCEKIFQLKDPYQFFDILVKYKKKLLDMGNTENFLDVLNWFFESYPKDIDFGNKSNRQLEDDFVDTIFSIFPMFFRA